MEEVRFRRLGTGSVFRLLAIGNLCGAVPLFTLAGIGAFFGFTTLTLNGRSVVGPGALIIGPCMGIAFALMATFVGGAIIWLGLMVYSRIAPLTLRGNIEP